MGRKRPEVLATASGRRREARAVKIERFKFISSVSLHGAVYDGFSIEIEGNRSLLRSDAYDEAAAIMKPYCDVLIRPHANS
ncbi:hypothetical protein [Bradyrhizobium sp. RDM4]|uniref:hypothetical protein n=1 Tax=Bradyrhizobium sp. RDM4 TaxID=3378765 RepID=UPI0038FD359F